MPFELTYSEKRVLGLPIEQDVPYKGKKPRKHGGRGTPKDQKTGTYIDMQKKIIDRGFVPVTGFSDHLNRMDGSKYAKAILDAYSDSEQYKTILNNVLRTDKIDSNKKLEIAAMLLRVSSNYVIGTMKDELQKEAIAAPLEELQKKLGLIIEANSKNARILADNALMERRSMHLSRILDLRSDLYVYTVACMVCVQTWRGTTLYDALLELRHEQGCPYTNDKQRVVELISKDPKDKLPLRSVLDHYKVNLPLRRIQVKDGTKDGKEIHLHYMPDDYRQYVITDT